ncbi:hypothetical protein LZ554_008058 [Drepanopeziza brunnea f. sp. 'monogermtubi']|nr:hypothetical protein LZ554_008058 [Drepanopeziza brunnea f. sp. 'monogermtubi']
MFPNGSHTLPRGFRYQEPKTPEIPFAEPCQPPPPPPRPRLKVRRSNAPSLLNVSTQQFLASVAAEDMPVPTIEIAERDDLGMPDREQLSIDTSALLPPSCGPAPKTPVPMLSLETAQRRPDWSMSASPADEYTRPSSSLSDTSYYSDDSFYSGSRASRPSDDGNCTSPEPDISDPFTFPVSKRKIKAAIQEDTFQAPTSTLNNRIQSKARSDAPWSKDQSAHLWTTYMLYLQDPTVTPFRITAGAVPPEGVCHRVAREARRSWKGQKVSSTVPVIHRQSRMISSSASANSGSPTPTVESPKVYGAWPHTSAATRHHLREMCRKTNDTAVSRYRHHQSPVPTPFTRVPGRSRTSAPPRPSPFSAHLDSSFRTKEIALSLTTSTAESMQPDGPLAQLAAEPVNIRRLFAPREEIKPSSFAASRATLGQSKIRRLASPFVARTYGPSSSKNSCASRPEPPRTQSDTSGSLGSPLHFNQPHSLNGTQKRRAQYDLEDELSPIVRPSILNEQLFGSPLDNSRRVRSRGFSLGNEALRYRESGVLHRSPPFQFPVFSNTESLTPQPSDPTSTAEPAKLLSCAEIGPQLGSPFSGSGPSNTFPRLLFQDGSATHKRSAFATMHQTRHSIESFDFGSGTGPSLQSRLQSLDTKLKEIREREAAAKQLR